MITITGGYIAEFWRTVYAADPNYRYQREGGVEPLPIESEAAAAAVELMIEAGVLIR